MDNRSTRAVELGIAVACGLLLSARSVADWNNAGGNSGRNGLISELGPDAAVPLWPANTVVPTSIIAWQPVIEGDRVFMVRQNNFIPNNVPNDSPIVAKNLHTGVTLWTVNLPYNSGDWTAWIAGVRDNKVYVSRSGNGASVDAKLHCLDAATGTYLWPTGSVELIDAGPYDGVQFAANGDPIIGSFQKIWRINAVDGTTVWSANRVGSVSSNCGGAAYEKIGAYYVVDAVVGGHAVKRFDINTGAFQYQGPLMPGFTLQNSPMVGPDGTIYINRTQNNVNTDFFYAFADTGSAITLKWSIPSRWTTSSEFGVGPDGSVYMIAPGNVISRRDPMTGAQMNVSAPIMLDTAGGNFTPRFAIDSAGRVFFSNGQFSNGRFYSFNADLSPRWNIAVPNINIGAPAIGDDGILVICGIGNNVKAYDTPEPVECPADIAPIPNGDGLVNVDDLLAVINAWGVCPPGAPCPADIAPPPSGDGTVGVDDLIAVINAWGPCR
jgi:hypothetical protein